MCFCDFLFSRLFSLEVNWLLAGQMRTRNGERVRQRVAGEWSEGCSSGVSTRSAIGPFLSQLTLAGAAGVDGEHKTICCYTDTKYEGKDEYANGMWREKMGKYTRKRGKKAKVGKSMDPETLGPRAAKTRSGVAAMEIKNKYEKKRQKEMWKNAEKIRENRQ